MPKPTISQAYQMIRLLKQRGQTGDAEKITQLRALIEEEKTKQTNMLLDTFFTEATKRPK